MPLNGSRVRKGTSEGHVTVRNAGMVMAIVAGLAAALPARAATPAGTRIANTARLTLTPDNAAPLAIDSNTVTITVDPLVDAAIVAERATTEIAAAAAATPVAFVVGNPGNAATVYRLAATADRDAIHTATIAADTDGDGRYDPAIDRPVAAVTLAAGATQRIFVLAGGALVDGAAITATVTADRADGTTLGTTGGTAAATARLAATAAPAARLDKEQAVVAPDGGSRAVSGAIVTYRLTARFARDCAAVELSDAVPVGTRFVPGSIALDGQPLSDRAADDAGRLEADTVRVALGDMPAGAVRTIEFKAIIL